MSNEWPDEPLHCCVCGDRIGDGCDKNVIYFCDKASDGAWCGTCFDATPCGKEEHGEGCPTMAVCGGIAERVDTGS